MKAIKRKPRVHNVGDERFSWSGCICQELDRLDLAGHRRKCGGGTNKSHQPRLHRLQRDWPGVLESLTLLDSNPTLRAASLR